MPLKFVNTLASFQSYINKIIIEKFDVFVIVYLNNIFIYANKISHVNSL